MYTAQDFQCDLPPVQLDRSVNILTVTDASTGVPYQIIANRDQLLGTETLQESFARQIKLAQRQTKGFTYKAFTERDNIQGQEPIGCIQTEFSQGGKKLHQLQAMVALQKPHVLVLTLSSGAAISDDMRKVWRQMLNTLKT